MSKGPKPGIPNLQLGAANINRQLQMEAEVRRFVLTLGRDIYAGAIRDTVQAGANPTFCRDMAKRSMSAAEQFAAELGMIQLPSEQ